MKKIIYSRIHFLQFFVVAILTILFSCEQDEVSLPVITEIRNYAASPDDTVVQAVSPGQWVVLTGQNLGGVSHVLFGSVPAATNNTLFTDGTIVVQVPAIPFQLVPTGELNKITVLNASGATTFTIEITGPPLITHLRNFADAPNDTLVDAISPGQKINIIGYNLRNALDIEFQGIKADLSNIIYTDSSAVITAPADFSSAGVLRANKVTYTTAIGTGTYSKSNYNDPLWTLLTGGVGKEKTWVVDFDATGASKKFNGPIYFTGLDLRWNNTCAKEGGACGVWDPTWQNWMPGPTDYGTMTFKLKGDPSVAVTQKGIGEKNGSFSGDYVLDPEGKTLTFTDVVPLNMGWDQVWSKAYIISLTEDGMQLAFVHTDKPEMEIYNYISKEFNDQWAPPPANEGFNPKFAPGELLSILTGAEASGRQWRLDANGNPIDWVNNGTGSGWTTDKNSTWNWGWNESWVTAIQDAWIMFDRFGGTQNYTRHQNGTTTTGTFSINEATNEITLTTNTLLVNPDSWMSPTANTIKVVKAYPRDLHSKGIWFGTSYDAGKNEWFVFHYIIP